MPRHFLEDLTVGQAAEARRTVTADDIDRFAAVSGDHNPVHVDEAFAATTQFKARIAHGMLAGAFISALLGEELPGPGGIYISQSLKFRRPIHIGDEVVTRVEITDIDARHGHVTAKTTCSVAGKAAVTGEAVMLVAKRPA
ncbi:MAG TPA: MaoC family dehydratase [Caulobacteraceae bacterium]|jgi:3-hydroxybutyryl-CoA dehydratase